MNSAAKATLEIIERGWYENRAGERVTFAEQQTRAQNETRLYSPEDAEALLTTEPSEQAPAFEVTGETTQVAAHRLAVEEQFDDVVLLNYASARNPGGGFINGAKAQEEDLCRCSGLYPCLLTQPIYYDVNRQNPSLLYTDHLIYSPAVPWFRTRSRNLLEQPFFASVITAPAPTPEPPCIATQTAAPKSKPPCAAAQGWCSASPVGTLIAASSSAPGAAASSKTTPP